jgi:carboxyl-terminal processing protease
MDTHGLLKYTVVVIALFSTCNLRPFNNELAREQYDFAVACLDAFFIFRERLPADYYAFPTPEALYESVHEPYTEYLNREWARYIISQLTTTNKGGIGIRIDSVAKGYVIKEVFSNSPGAAAGLQALDTIIRVDDTPTAGLAWGSFTELLQGDIGTQVLLRIKRGGNQMNIIVTRGEFSSPSVFVDSIDTNVASIILTGFYEETNTEGGSAAEFSAALDKTGWATYTIIDLRRNTGGYITQCVDIIGDLVPPQTKIVKTHERTFDTVTMDIIVIDSIYVASGSGKAADRTLLLLVDGYTASASEMMVSCLMQRKDVTVIGDTTFGKGRGQVMLWGPDSVIAKVTCMTITPAGDDAVNYDGVGIAPDIIADTVDAFDVALSTIAETAPAKRLALRAGRGPGRCDARLHMGIPLAIVDSRYGRD